jgi:hypothetical protein
MPSWARSAARRCSRWAILPIALLSQACGSSEHARSPTPPAIPPALLAQARPIGRGPAFQPPANGPVLGRCAGGLGPRAGVHVEVFAANRVVLIPAGIGTRPPRGFSEGRIARARCYGALVTLDPTGLVLVRPGARLHLADLFRSWGQPLTTDRLLTFRTATKVRVFVNGRVWPGMPQSVPLRRHAEIVLEVGPYVPPHAAYTFPRGV